MLPPEVEAISATDDGSTGHHGRVTDLLSQYLPWADQVFACGPNAMFASMADVVRQERSSESPCKRSWKSGWAAAPASAMAAPYSRARASGWSAKTVRASTCGKSSPRSSRQVPTPTVAAAGLPCCNRYRDASMRGSKAGWIIAAIVAAGSLLVFGGMIAGMSLTGHMDGLRMHGSGGTGQTPAAVSGQDGAVVVQDFDYIPGTLQSIPEPESPGRTRMALLTRQQVPTAGIPDASTRVSQAPLSSTRPVTTLTSASITPT